MEAIAQYTSSDEEQDADHSHPSLPTRHLNPSTSDPSLHTTTEDRVRSFPHVPGNFAVHVFINVPTPSPCLPHLEQLLQQIKQSFPDFAPIESSGSIPLLESSALPLQLVQTSYHVSLSRTLPIRLPLAQPLITSLRNHLHQIKRFTLRIHPVLEVFLNDDKTRTFLALKVSARPVLAVQLLQSRNKAATAAVAREDKEEVPSDPLLQAINAVSDAFEIEELQRFYDVPRPHISLGWLLGDQSEALSAAWVRCESGFGDGHSSHNENNKFAAILGKLGDTKWEVEPEVIWCKVGQVNHSIWKSKR